MHMAAPTSIGAVIDPFQTRDGCNGESDARFNAVACLSSIYHFDPSLCPGMTGEGRVIP